MANLGFPNNKLYQFEVMPVLLSCNFVVDHTNGNGFGVRQLKGQGISRIYMNSSSSAGSPAPGLILVQFTDKYMRYLSGFSGQVSPLSGSPLSSTVASQANIIVSLGSSTLAQWQAAGLPVGIVPAVGVAFIPKVSAAIAGGGLVELPRIGGSGIDHIEVAGDPNQTIISPIPLPPPLQPVGAITGGEMVLMCLNAGALTAPVDGTVISLSFYLSNSSSMVQGQ